MQDNRPAVYWEDEKLVVRASAIGGCLWELIAYAQGYTPNAVPKTLEKAWEDGQRLESSVLEYVSESGWELYGGQKEGHLRVGPRAMVRFHTDSLGKQPRTAREFVVEVKCLSDATWRDAQRRGVGSLFQEYPWQLSVMMIAEDKPGMWVAYNKDSGEVLWEPVYEPPIPFHQIASKVNSLVEALDDDLSTRPCDDPKHWPCRFLSLRPEPETTANVLYMYEIGMNAEFDEVAKEYVRLKGQEDEIIKRRKEAGIRLRGMVGNFTDARSDKFKLKVKHGRNVHADREAMRRDGVEDKYTRETLYDYVEVRGLE